MTIPRLKIIGAIRSAHDSFTVFFLLTVLLPECKNRGVVH